MNINPIFNMKIRNIMLIFALMFLAVSVFVVAKPNFVSAESKSGPTVVVPAHAVELAPGIFSLGESQDVDGRIVEGFMFIDKKKGFGHKPKHNPGGDRGGGNGGAKCFEFLAKGAKWKVTEPYVLDTSNSDGMTSNFVASRTATGIDAWDTEVAFDIFGARDTTSTVDGADTESPDNKNEIFFGDIESEGAIAVAIVWGRFFGPPSQREIVEYDIIFDDVDFDFGDADVSGTSVMDYQNIFTHEIGHGAGMGHPQDECTEETMFRFASFGEIKKRTLEVGDISGVNKLYS